MSKRVFWIFVLTIAMSLMAVEFRRSYADDHIINTVYVISDKISCEAYGGTWEDSGNTCSVEFWNVKNTDVVTIESGVVFQGMFFLNNYGTINNYGTFTSFDLYNGGTINNYGLLKPGYLHNNTLVNNYGTIFNINSNPYGITNPGTIDNHCQGEITGPGTIAPTQTVVNTPGSDACQNNLTPTATPTPTNTPTNTPDVPTPTATPTPQAAHAVIFIPGMMGSQMRYREGNEYDLAHDSYLWPTYFDGAKKRMSMKDGGNPRVYTDYVVTEYRPFNLPFPIDIYNKLINRLVHTGYIEYQTGGDPNKRVVCDESQKSATLFVLPWDFRIGASKENVDQLDRYVECAMSLNGGADVDLVVHSMGGYLAQQYVLSKVDNGEDPHIRKFISIGTPWLGAPKSLVGLLTGSLDESTNKLISAEYVKGLTEHFIGSHELLPSLAYFDRSNIVPFVLSKVGNDGITRLADEFVSRNDFGKAIRDYYRSPWEPEGYLTNEDMVGHNNALFSDPRFYDWVEKYNIEYHLIYGSHWLQTIGQIRAEDWKICRDDLAPCTIETIYKARMVIGDGTVPYISAKKFGAGYDYNHNATLHPFVDGPDSPANDLANHLGLTQNTKVQDCVLTILSSNTCPSTVAKSASEVDDEIGGVYPLKYIMLWGISSLKISDGITTTDELITNTLTLDRIPGVAVDHLGESAINITFLATRAYTVTAISKGVVFADILDGTNNFTPTQSITYSNVLVPAGEILQLRSSAPLSATLAHDTDRDGVAETVISPIAKKEDVNIFLPLIVR